MMGGQVRKLKIKMLTISIYLSISRSGSFYLMYTEVEAFISDKNSDEKHTEKMTEPIFPEMKPIKSFVLCFG